jgi:hypothetical protein
MFNEKARGGSISCQKIDFFEKAKTKKLVCYDPPLIFFLVLIFWKDKVCAKK